MPAQSQQQQKFMGMVHALNKGDIKPSDVSKSVRDVAKNIKKSDAKDFASTKHNKIPKKVKQEILKALKEYANKMSGTKLGGSGSYDYAPQKGLRDDDGYDDNEGPKDEGFASDAQRRAAFASGYKAKGKKKKKEVVEAVKVLKFTKVKDNTLEKHLKFISKKVGAELSKIDGGFRVDADGDIKKLTSVVDYVFDKSIKKGLMKGGGMSQINLVKEAMDKRQGAETLKQLGGNRFIMMTGAKHFGVGPNGMSFKIGKNSKRVNHVTIDYDRGRDLYNMKFDWVTIKGIKTKKKLKGIYADQLQDMFTRYTGMYTSL